MINGWFWKLKLKHYVKISFLKIIYVLFIYGNINEYSFDMFCCILCNDFLHIFNKLLSGNASIPEIYDVHFHWSDTITRFFFQLNDTHDDNF